MRTIKHTRSSILFRRRPSKISTRRGPNFKQEKKTQPEADFEARFLTPMVREGKIKHLHFHALRFNSGYGSWYEPDFTAINAADNRLLVWEIKGLFVWEDAVVKFKACALLYPWCSWTWAEQDKGKNWMVIPVGEIDYSPCKRLI